MSDLLQAASTGHFQRVSGKVYPDIAYMLYTPCLKSGDNIVIWKGAGLQAEVCEIK